MVREVIKVCMFYFAQFEIDSLSKDNVENAIRNFSSKRYTSLDLQSSSSSIKENKYFLGHEGKADLKITRIRTTFEKLFPKVIQSFPKGKRFEVYKVRYSLLSTVVFFLLSMAVL